ncbi:putative fumarate hydratase [Helianthus annuus]|nr:putative fumarate hydratase [Helianthus annuus]
MGGDEFLFNRLWGAQTQRSLQNSEIGGKRERMHEPIIRSFGILKKCAAKVFHSCNFATFFSYQYLVINQLK